MNARKRAISEIGTSKEAMKKTICSFLLASPSHRKVAESKNSFQRSHKNYVIKEESKKKKLTFLSLHSDLGHFESWKKIFHCPTSSGVSE